MRNPLRTRSPHRDPLGDVSFFTGLPRHERNELLPLMTSASVAPGTVVVEQGAPGSEFFIIVDGLATVLRDGRPIAVLAPGDHFGEISLLGDHVLRTATVQAVTP